MDHQDIDSYISGFTADKQKKLEELRSLVRAVAPEAQETISYGMPAYKLKGVLVYFAAHRNHIGLYPGAMAISHFEAELSSFHTSKGTVQFPLDHPLPKALIKKIVLYKVQENLMKAELRKRKK